MSLKSRSAGLVAGAVALLAGASPALAAPASVSVRVEGATETLVSETPVTTTAAAVNKQGNPCSGTSAGGALELATAGDWGGYFDPAFGQTVERIRTEVYPINPPSSRYWSFWVNNKPASAGICTTELEQGDEVLLFADCATAGCVSLKPLVLSAPRTARRGQPLAVKVEEVALDSSFTAVRVPSAGATLTGAGPAVTTQGDGSAVVTPDRAGFVVLRATKPDGVRDSAILCVAAGDDGTCGTTAAGQPAASGGAPEPRPRRATPPRPPHASPGSASSSASAARGRHASSVGPWGPSRRGSPP
jgi:hypothetical protein